MRNITVRQYSQLQDVSVYEILESLKPSGEIKVGGKAKRMNIRQMPYANVKYCIRLMQKVQTWEGIKELFSVCFDITEREFWKLKVTDYFAARRFLIREFERVVQTEGKLLASQSTDEHIWQMAGADKLKPHNDTLPLVQLGKMFGQYPFEIGRKPYSEVFSLMVQTKVMNEVERDYQKLISKK